MQNNVIYHIYIFRILSLHLLFLKCVSTVVVTDTFAFVIIYINNFITVNIQLQIHDL